MELSFEDIRKLSNHQGNYFSQEVRGELKGLIRVNPSVTLEASHAYGVYKTRHRIQLEVTKHDKIDGWEPLLENLQKISTTKLPVELNLVLGEKYGFMFFTNPEHSDLFGLLRFKDQTIDLNRELDEYRKIKEHYSKYSFYLNGECLTTDNK